MILTRSFKPLIEHHILRVRVKHFLFSFRITILRLTLYDYIVGAASARSEYLVGAAEYLVGAVRIYCGEQRGIYCGPPIVGARRIYCGCIVTYILWVPHNIYVLHPQYIRAAPTRVTHNIMEMILWVTYCGCSTYILWVYIVGIYCG